MFKSLGVDLDIPLTITPLSFEYLNIHERTILLSLLDRIMKIPCDLIVDRAYEYGISNASFGIIVKITISTLTNESCYGKASKNLSISTIKIFNKSTKI